MSTIAPADLYQRILSQPNLRLLDVRTPMEFTEVRVPQAFNVPLAQLNPRALVESGRLHPSEPLYLICRTDNRSAQAAEKFRQDGFTAVTVVTGGTIAWDAAGLPVERRAVKVISLERQVRIAAGALVLTGMLLGWWVHPGFFGLATFVGAGLVFAGITDYCGMGLLLAKLPWNQRQPDLPAAPKLAH